MNKSALKKYAAVSLVIALFLSFTVNASYRYGDINSDDKITASDAALLLAYVLNPAAVNIDDEVLQHLDINMDNKITAADCAEILYKTLNNAYIMPIEKNDSTSGSPFETTTVTDVSTETTTREATTESTTADPNSIHSSGYTFTIGQSESSLPKADTVRTTPDGITWYAYDADYLHYTRVGVHNGAIVKIVSYDTSAAYDDVHIGDTIDYATGSTIDYNYTRLSETRLFIDTNDNNKLYAIMLTSRSYYTSSLDYSPEKCTALSMQIADDTNAFRAQHNLLDLVWNPDLAEVSQAYAEDMAENGFFDHIDLNGQNPGDRIENAGLIYYYYGENINAGYYSAEESINGWVNSSGHRANILNENFTQIGVGAAYNPDDTLEYYTRCVQNFFTPLR